MGTLVPTTLPRSSIRHTIFIPYFLCRCTLLGNGRYKSNWQHPLRSRLLFPYKALRDIFVYCGLLLYHWWSAHALDNTINNQIRWCCSISLWIQPIYCPAHCNNQERIQISEENSISDYFAGYQPQQSLYCVLQQKASRRQRLQMCPGTLYQKTFKNHLSPFKYRSGLQSCFTDIIIHTTQLIQSTFFEGLFAMPQNP